MSKELDEIMAKLEAGKKKAPVIEDPEEPEDDDEETPEELEEVEDDLDPEEEEEPKEVPKVVKKKEVKTKPSNEALAQEELALLQNEGIFRRELLYQLREINQNLLVLNKLASANLEK